MNNDSLIRDLDDYQKRRKAASALGSMLSGSEHAVPPLVNALLTDKDQATRKEILKAIGRIAGRAADQIPTNLQTTVLTQLNVSLNENERVFGLAARIIIDALGKTGRGLPVAGWAYPILAAALKEQAFYSTAFEALEEMPGLCRELASVEAVPALVRALKIQDEPRRWATLGLLQKFGTSAGSAVPALGDLLLTSKDADNQNRILEILEGVGDEAACALVELREFCSREENPKLRATAQSLLSRIEPLNVKFELMVKYMLQALVELSDPGPWDLREKNRMFSIIVKNWQLPNEEIAAKLMLAGIDFEGAKGAENVAYIKSRCDDEYHRLLCRRWWQFWK